MVRAESALVGFNFKLPPGLVDFPRRVTSLIALKDLLKSVRIP